MTADADALATAWTTAISGHGYVPLNTQEVRALLRSLGEELLAAMAAETLDPQRVRRIGVALVHAHFTDPAALEATLRVLGEHLGANMPGPRLIVLQSALAAGYAQALRELTLAEQEQLGKAIINAHAQVEQAARESEARFRAIFAGAAIGIGISDASGRIVQANQALADLLGYTVPELCQLNVIDLMYPTGEPTTGRRYQEFIAGSFDHLRMEQAYPRKDGGKVWTDLTVSLIRAEDGQPKYTVAMVDDITERYRLQERLRHQALHDPLSHLPNRTLFGERLAAALDTTDLTDRVGVCYLDLDGFKHINDSLGHNIGDQLLIEVARRLDECARASGHLAARMGGDEFVILVEHSTGVDQVIDVAQAVLTALNRPIRVGRHRLRVSASAGVVERPVAGASAEEIMKAADVTLYWAKSDGRGRWAVYDPARVEAELARFELSAALPHALDRGEFTLVYQPIVGLHDHRLHGVEALVRWRHPRLGLLTPDHFIGLAEETGLIVPLGRHVLRSACRQAERWRQQFRDASPFVSVNLAPAQTQEASLVADVEEALADTGLDARRLQLELTESAAMATSGAPLEALRTLANGGVRVAIDDFGTGYSNLAYLRMLPVHVLKLAGPFIEGLREPDPQGGVDERIVDSLIRLAHAIDLTVTAEGVETRSQADRLRVLGCDTVQGYYFARPQTPHQVTRMLSEAQPR